MLAASMSRSYGGRATALGLGSERLSASMRISRAQDDAAGLAVSEKLRTQSRGTLHIAHAIGFVRGAEASLREVTELLQRVRVLAVQSAKYAHGEYSLPHEAEPDLDDLLNDLEAAQDHMLGSMRELLVPYTAADVTDVDTGTAVPLESTGAPWALRARVGANTGEALAVNVFAPDIRHYFAGETAPAGQQAPAASPLVDIRTQTGALRAIVNIDAAVLDLNHQRAHLSAFSNRLENALHTSPDLTADIEVFTPSPAQATIPPREPAAADAQGKLLGAIGQEARNLAEQFPGQASARLAELARAYALVTSSGAGHLVENALAVEAEGYPAFLNKPSVVDLSSENKWA
ncbi:hypothetical protein ACFQFR_36245 [Streptomyces goshikiensis]